MTITLEQATSLLVDLDAIKEVNDNHFVKDYISRLKECRTAEESDETARDIAGSILEDLGRLLMAADVLGKYGFLKT